MGQSPRWAAGGQWNGHAPVIGGRRRAGVLDTPRAAAAPASPKRSPVLVVCALIAGRGRPTPSGRVRRVAEPCCARRALGELARAAARRAPCRAGRARAAVSRHQALDAHEAFEGMRGDAPCSLPLLVARCQAPDGYLLAPFQEALLQLYGASLAAEIAGTADAASAGADLASRTPCPGPAALAPRDDAAVAAAARLAAPRRRRRPRRQRRAEGEADARAAPANAGAPPAPPSAGEQRDPLLAMREVDLAHELRSKNLHTAVASRPHSRCPEGRADRRPDRGTARPELSGRLEALPPRPASRAWGNARS